MNVYLVTGVRTPFCKAQGAFEKLPVQELGQLALRELVARSELDPGAIDAVVTGMVACPMDAANVSRVIGLLAGLPESTPAHTVSRNCASGMEAAVDAARRIACGEAGIVAALGVESMSRIPLVFSEGFQAAAAQASRARSGIGRLAAWARLRTRDLRPIPALLQGLTDPTTGLNMGQTAERLAREFSISREEQDRFALRSHERAIRARKAGALRAETVAVFVPPAYAAVAEDIGPREGQSLEKLQKLRPVFDRERGSVTAGNSSMITDGAVALLLASEERVRALNLKPLARLAGQGVAGLDPRRMGLGPVFAAPRALAAAGRKLRDMDLVEINEAFAAQVIACVKALGSADFARRELGLDAAVGELDEERLNVNGGAIALGHPVGASGARLLLHLARELERRRARYGLATLCVGGGQGQAVVLEAAA